MRPPLVLIHGFASSTLVWSKVFFRLAEAGYRVIAPDLMGFGYSGKPKNGEYTIPGQARLLTRLLDSLGIPRAIFVGSSYGGAVAATCALDYPDRVEKLVLVGTVSNNRPLAFNLMRVFGSPLVRRRCFATSDWFASFTAPAHEESLRSPLMGDG